MSESSTMNPATGYERREENPHGHMIERQANKVSTDVFLWAAVGSIVGSLALKVAGQDKSSLFVGQWAPTLVALGLYSKLNSDTRNSSPY